MRLNNHMTREWSIDVSRAQLSDAKSDIAVAKRVAFAMLLTFVGQLLAVYHSIVTIRLSDGDETPLIYRVLAWIPIYTIVPYLVRNQGTVKSVVKSPSILTCAIIVALASAAIGTITCYGSIASRYFWGDWLRFATPWLAFYLATWTFGTLAARNQLEFLRNTLDLLAVIAVLDGLITVFAGVSFFGWHISTSFFLFGVIWAVFQNRHHYLIGAFVFSVGALACVVSSKRSNLVCLGVALLASVAILLHKRMVRKVAQLAFIGAIGLAVVTVVGTESGSLLDHVNMLADQVHEALFARDGDRDSMEYRDNEVRNIMSFFRAEDNYNWIPFGYGFGCEIPTEFSEGVDETSRGNMHHVHMGIWVYALRNGVVGVVLLLTFCFLSAVRPWFHLGSPHWREIAVCLVFCIERVVTVGAGNLMLEDVDLPVMTALCFAWTQFDTRALPQSLNV